MGRYPGFLLVTYAVPFPDRYRPLAVGLRRRFWNSFASARGRFRPWGPFKPEIGRGRNFRIVGDSSRTMTGSRKSVAHGQTGEEAHVTSILPYPYEPDRKSV